MNEQTDKLIRDLAEKLGTTAEHLWGVLVRQAPIQATATLVALLVSLTAAVICLTYAKKLISAALKNDNEPMGVAGALLALVGIGIGVFFLIELSDFGIMLSGFFNPEYWALKQVMR